MSALALLGNIPVAVWIGLLLSTVIPYVSALLTDHPGHLTGVITAALSGLTGVLTTFAASGDVTWKAAGAALLSWLIATTTHSKVLAGTPVEASLHAAGSRPNA